MTKFSAKLGIRGIANGTRSSNVASNILINNKYRNTMKMSYVKHLYKLYIPLHVYLEIFWPNEWKQNHQYSNHII